MLHVHAGALARNNEDTTPANPETKKKPASKAARSTKRAEIHEQSYSEAVRVCDEAVIILSNATAVAASEDAARSNSIPAELAIVYTWRVCAYV
jgi:hypothetical protein